MRGTITIGTKEVEMLGNAATSILYKRIFHSDLLKALSSFSTAEENILEAVEVVQRLAFIMSQQATDGAGVVSSKMTEDDFVRWLMLFDETDFQNPDTLIGVMGIWNRNIKSSVEQKNG